MVSTSNGSITAYQNQPDNGAPVRIFVMGPNVWRNENEWPLARAVATRYYLTSGGAANSVRGDGKLLTQTPEREARDKFKDDPERPVPSRGGCTLMTGVQSAGPRDQRPVEERDDVLIYTSAPLNEPLEVTGTIEAVLYASTDGRDTDFTVEVVDVVPDGSAINLCDGIMRARYRNALRRAELLEPESVYGIRFC